MDAARRTGSLRECLAQVRYFASSEPVRNQAIVGKSRIVAALERCDRSVILLHNHHFPFFFAGAIQSGAILDKNP
jgi:hypothetical protein